MLPRPDRRGDLDLADDHSRLALSLTAHRTVTAEDVLAAFRAAYVRYGPPASTLTENGTASPPLNEGTPVLDVLRHDTPGLHQRVSIGEPPPRRPLQKAT